MRASRPNCSRSCPAARSIDELCKAIMNELRADDQIKDAGVLPDFINLPELTSVEYVKVGVWVGWGGG